MATPQTLITSALKKAGVLGVGQTALSEDSNDGLEDLNQLIAQWNRQRFLVYRLVDTAFTSTGAASYTVGPSGNFNLTPRPDQIEAAYVRQVNIAAPNQVDYPLRPIRSREDYSRIALKSLTSFPQYFFYDPVITTGILYTYPVASTTIYELHILTKVVISTFANLATAVTLPPEYETAIVWNLAQIFRISYQLPEDSGVNKKAAKSLAIIRAANVAVPTLEQPPAVLGKIRPYNVFSDNR